jgi:hypothetical protein
MNVVGRERSLNPSEAINDERRHLGRFLQALAVEQTDVIVFERAPERQIPVAFVLAGGYVSDGLPQSLLVGLHRMTIRAALLTAVSIGLA